MEGGSCGNGNQEQQLGYEMVRAPVPARFSQGSVYSDKTPAEMIHFHVLLCLKWKRLSLASLQRVKLTEGLF